MKHEINELNTQTQAKEIKSKILSRIQQQLNREPGAEGMIYMKNVQHDKG